MCYVIFDARFDSVHSDRELLNQECDNIEAQLDQTKEEKSRWGRSREKKIRARRWGGKAISTIRDEDPLLVKFRIQGSVPRTIGDI